MSLMWVILIGSAALPPMARDSAHIKLAELNNIVAANNKRFIAHIAI
jgi:hypothetical protein